MPRQPSQKLKNYVAIVLDRSWSMESLRAGTVQAFNELLESIKIQSKAYKQETYITLITYASDVTVVSKPTKVDNCKPLQLAQYQVGGQTAMFDAWGKAIELLQNRADADDPNVSFVVKVITDGVENDSSVYNPRNEAGRTKITKLIQSLDKDGRWTLVFQVPTGRRERLITNFPVPPDNVAEWETTGVGVQQATSQNVAGIQNFFQSRSVGTRSVKSYYQVTTNLAKVSPSKVKRKLKDLSLDFKCYEVPRELSIREFVESKTRKAYVIGSAFYQLTKPEKVQPRKAVLLMKKGEKAVFGGQEARDLIGLPAGEHAKVTPGNHSDWNIFVQSTSVNRKLVRGTKILLDINRKRNLKPTWDHTAVT